MTCLPDHFCYCKCRIDMELINLTVKSDIASQLSAI